MRQRKQLPPRRCSPRLDFILAVSIAAPTPRFAPWRFFLQENFSATAAFGTCHADGAEAVTDRLHYTTPAALIFTKLYAALPDFTVEFAAAGVSIFDRRTVEKEKHKMKTKFWSVAVALLALVLCGTAMISYAQQNDESGASRSGAAIATDTWAIMAKRIEPDRCAEGADQDHHAGAAHHHPSPDAADGAESPAMLTATASGAFDQAKVQALATQQLADHGAADGAEGSSAARSTTRC